MISYQYTTDFPKKELFPFFFILLLLFTRHPLLAQSAHFIYTKNIDIDHSKKERGFCL